MKTEREIALTIFDGERCITTLEDLEAAAKAIHQKAVREQQTSAHPSTLSAEIESRKTLLNAQSQPDGTTASCMTTPVTFPARPINGGKLELAPPKRGLWFAEPKFSLVTWSR